jgi:hypothetical protein
MNHSVQIYLKTSSEKLANAGIRAQRYEVGVGMQRAQMKFTIRN